jgi:hypothetical protein
VNGSAQNGFSAGRPTMSSSSREPLIIVSMSRSAAK